MILVDFKTTIVDQFIRILAERGGTTLTEDGYEAFTALTKSIIRYANQSARADARFNELEAHLEAMAMNPQSLELGLSPQVTNYAYNDVGPPPGFYDHQEYGYYVPQEATNHRHPGPFGSPQERAQYAKPSGHPSFEGS